MMKTFFVIFAIISRVFAAPTLTNSTLTQASISGPWTTLRIDEFIHAGFHPIDNLPDDQGSLVDHVTAYHGDNSDLITYCYNAWIDHQFKLDGKKVVPNPPTQIITGPWSQILIDAWISAGYHPDDDSLPDGRGSLLTHIHRFYHEEEPELDQLTDHCYESWREFQHELDLIKHFSEDTSELKKLRNLNDKIGHRENTLLHLYCRSELVYVVPILWLYRYGANPDQPNKVGITPRDLLKGRDLEALFE